MTPTLRDAMQAVRINRMKQRAEIAWQRQRREAEPSEHPVCPGCGKRHPRGLLDLLRGELVAVDDDVPPPGPDKSRH